MCVQVSLTRKLGYVHDRQPTMVLQVSFRIRTEEKKEKKKKRKKGKCKSVTVVFLFAEPNLFELIKSVRLFCIFNLQEVFVNYQILIFVIILTRMENAQGRRKTDTLSSRRLRRVGTYSTTRIS